MNTPVRLKLLRILVHGLKMDGPATGRLGEVMPAERKEGKAAADYAAGYLSVAVHESARSNNK